MDCFKYEFDEGNFKESLKLFSDVQNELLGVIDAKIHVFHQWLEEVGIMPDKDASRPLSINFRFHRCDFSIEFKDIIYKTETKSGWLVELMLMKKLKYQTSSNGIRVYNEYPVWKTVNSDIYFDKLGDFYTKYNEAKLKDLDVFRQVLSYVVANCYDER